MIIACMALVSASCTRVKSPVVDHNPTLNWNLYPNADTSSYPWPTWTTNTNTTRKVLLEDFTGHLCISCPSAATIAKNIEDNANGEVIVMSVHASTNSSNQLPELPEFPLDHRTDAGNEYAVALNIPVNPLGTINRKQDGSQYWYLSPSWQSEVNTELTKSPDFNIQVQYNYYSQTNGLFLHTEVEALNDISGSYSIVNLLIRDTVIAPQKDQGGVVHHHYDHHSVLSGDINGIWGTPIISEAIATGDKIYNHFSYQLPNPTTDSTYNVNNLSIISFVCDIDNYEVMQVIKTPLAP